MNIELVVVGRTDSEQIGALVENYARRVGFYTRFDIRVIPDVKKGKGLSEKEQKALEGEAILKAVEGADFVALLDERGAELGSEEFAGWIQKRMNASARRLCFVIGGPYGFSEAVYGRADGKISLSRMTFSHQMVRLIFCEQLYRAFTILRGEPYHHT